MLVRVCSALFSISILMLAANLAADAQANSTSQAPSTAPVHVTSAGRTAETQDTIDALKGDLQRMRTLLVQMKTNAGLAANVTSPLYHQFELENAMWQMQVDQLQRHVDALERANRAPR
jgi:hypothetical protein